MNIGRYTRKPGSPQVYREIAHLSRRRDHSGGFISRKYETHLRHTVGKSAKTPTGWGWRGAREGREATKQPLSDHLPLFRAISAKMLEVRLAPQEHRHYARHDHDPEREPPDVE